MKSTSRYQRRSQKVKAASESAQVSIVQVPDEVLVRVFLKLQRASCRDVLPLVCKQWMQLLERPSPLWESVIVQLQPTVNYALDWALCAKWLAARAPGMKRLQLTCKYDPKQTNRNAFRTFLPSVFGALLAGSLRELNLQQLSKYMKDPSPGSLESLSWLQSLQTLTLSDLPMAVHAQGLNALGNLTSLTSLILIFEPMTDTADGLDLRVEGGFPVEFARLVSLRQLVMKNAGRDAFEVLPPMISCLKSLQVLSIDHCGVNSLGHGFASLRKLSSLYVTSWMVDDDLVSPITFPYAASLPELENVILSCIRVPIQFGSCKNIRRLSLARLDQSPAALNEALDVLLRDLHQLDSLHLDSCRLTEFPPTLANVTSLQLLDIGNNDLQMIPWGPYLNRLEVLGLYRNELFGVPVALRDAPALRVLDMSRRDGWELSEHDRLVLGSMPNLTDLWLARESPWSGASVEALCSLCRGANADLVINTTEQDDVHPELIWVTNDDMANCSPELASGLVN